MIAKTYHSRLIMFRCCLEIRLEKAFIRCRYSFYRIGDEESCEGCEGSSTLSMSFRPSLSQLLAAPYAKIGPQPKPMCLMVLGAKLCGLSHDSSPSPSPRVACPTGAPVGPQNRPSLAGLREGLGSSSQREADRHHLCASAK